MSRQPGPSCSKHQCLTKLLFKDSLVPTVLIKSFWIIFFAEKLLGDFKLFTFLTNNGNVFTYNLLKNLMSH